MFFGVRHLLTYIKKKNYNKKNHFASLKFAKQALSYVRQVLIFFGEYLRKRTGRRMYAGSAHFVHIAGCMHEAHRMSAPARLALASLDLGAIRDGSRLSLLSVEAAPSFRSGTLRPPLPGVIRWQDPKWIRYVL
jgi:hypothetical protein